MTHIDPAFLAFFHKRYKSSWALFVGGSLFVAFFLYAEPILSRGRGGSTPTPLALRALFYVALLPYLLFSYWYRPLKDLWNIRKIITQLDSEEQTASGELFTKGTALFHKTGETVQVFIYSRTYLCQVYHLEENTSKKYFFPLSQSS